MAIIFIGVLTVHAVAWLIHCGAEEKERCIIECQAIEQNCLSTTESAIQITKDVLFFLVLTTRLCCEILLQDRSNAQSSCAGLFIGAHLGFDYPGVWIHVDMAAPAYLVCMYVCMYVCM